MAKGRTHSAPPSRSVPAPGPGDPVRHPAPRRASTRTRRQLRPRTLSGFRHRSPSAPRYKPEGSSPQQPGQNNGLPTVEEPRLQTDRSTRPPWRRQRRLHLRVRQLMTDNVVPNSTRPDRNGARSPERRPAQTREPTGMATFERTEPGIGVANSHGHPCSARRIGQVRAEPTRAPVWRLSR